jgi:hypothetical protein
MDLDGTIEYLYCKTYFELIMYYSNNESNLLCTTQVNSTWVERKVIDVLQLT